MGTIAGGTALNVVPDQCRVVGEARSLDDARLEALVTEMIDHLHDAAGAAECDLDLAVADFANRLMRVYRYAPLELAQLPAADPIGASRMGWSIPSSRVNAVSMKAMSDSFPRHRFQIESPSPEPHGRLAGFDQDHRTKRGGVKVLRQHTLPAERERVEEGRRLQRLLLP